MQRRGDIPDRWMTSNLGTGQRGRGRAAQTDAEEEPLGWSPHVVQEEGGERKGGCNIGRIWFDPVNYR